MINRTTSLNKGTYKQPDIFGYYGNFGGAYIPEMLHRNVEELKDRYIEIIYEASFQKEFQELLKDYAGRSTPLYLAKRLSKQYGTKIFLKGEDLCHTGAHKINNTIGQILLALRLGKKRIIAETGAGQHGVATATVCALKGVECIVYMGEKDIERQAPNVARMKMLGATVIPATSGSKTLKNATTQLGKPGVLHGSKSLVMQTEDGQVVEPHSISAGLDYPGIGPLHAHLYDSGRAKFLSATDNEALAAAFELAKLEGIIPALESAHALAKLKDLTLLSL